MSLLGSNFDLVELGVDLTVTAAFTVHIYTLRSKIKTIFPKQKCFIYVRRFKTSLGTKAKIDNYLQAKILSFFHYVANLH